MKIKVNKYISIAIIMTFANIFGKILGFLRDIFVSYYYGTSAISDAFFLTIGIPTMILGVFTSASDSAIIPQYNRIKMNEGREEADKNFSNIINILCVIGVIVTILILLFPQYCLKLFAPGFSDEQNLYGIKFLRFFSTLGLSHIIYCFFTTYNTIYNKIGIRAILSFSTNLLVIIAILLKPDKNMMSITIAFLIGNILAGVLPVLYAKYIKYKHTFKINLKSIELKKFLIIFYPIMLAALLNDLNLFIDKFLASNMAEGSVSALNYGSKIISIFDNMLVIGLSIVILPMFSKLKINNQNEKFASYATIIIKLVIIILLPLAIIATLMSRQIIEFIYMRGSFDINSLNLVSAIFFGYAIQILLLSIQAIFTKLFHSMENTKITLYISFAGVLINIILSIILSKIIGLQGIAIATSISILITCILLFIKFKNSIGWDYKSFNYIDCIKLIIGALIVVGTIFYTKELTNKTILNIIISSVTSYGLYSIFIFITMKKFLKNTIQILRKNKKIEC